MSDTTAAPTPAPRRPRRIWRWVRRAVTALLVLPLLLIACLLVALNTAPGQRFAAQTIGRVTSGQVMVRDINGRFPDALRVGRVEVADAKGVWIAVDNAALDWSPLRLLHGEVHVDRLAAARIAVERQPEPSGTSSGGTFALPVRVVVDRLHVDRIDIAQPVAGHAAAFTADGTATLNSLEDGAAKLALHRIDGKGSYSLDGRIGPAGLHAQANIEEPAPGLVAAFAGLPGVPTLSAHASIDGPWTGAATKLDLAAGELRANANGHIDVRHQAADLDVTASAPAMTPRPGLSWKSVALDLHVHGPFTAPNATGALRVEDLDAEGVAASLITADLAGDKGAASLKASVEALRIPGPKPDLLQATPLRLQADARLDATTLPVTFALDHKLLSAKGTAQLGGDLRAQAHVMAPDLAPLAAIGGIDLQGSTGLDVTAAMAGADLTLAVDGTLGVTGGLTPVPALIGSDARLGVTATLAGSDVTLSRLRLDGKTLAITGQGGLKDRTVTLDWTVALSNLTALAPSLSGTLDAKGSVTGKTDDLAATADLQAMVATTGKAPEKIVASLTAQGLPAAPSGQITAEGSLDGAPLTLVANASRANDGTLRLTIDRGAWKSATADGALSLAPGAQLPEGKLSLRIDRLDDLRALSGQALTGAVSAAIDLGSDNGRPVARMQAEARDAGMAGMASIGRATLTARVADPMGTPVTEAKLIADGVRAGSLTGSMTLDANGPATALALRLSGSLQGLDGGPAQASAAASLDTTARQLRITALQAMAKGETLRLLAPATVSFATGVAVDRAQLGLRAATLEIAGRAAPDLGLTVTLRNLPADLARLVSPDLAMDGTIGADARLQGTPSRPTGSASLTATGVRLRGGPGAALPAASLTATATLQGATAQVDAKLTAGATRLHLAGGVPIDPAAGMNLRANGSADLAMLDPLIAANGRRIRGKVTLDATITGPPTAPNVNGAVDIANADVQDFAQGARISAINGRIEARGDTIRIVRLAGSAKTGTISVTGGVGLRDSMPVDLTVTARKAQPLASDRLTATLDADLTLRGALQARMDVAGTIHIIRADIRIPERLPAQVATLEVRLPGQPPPPPPPPAETTDIGLDVTVTAPGQIFVRGRGVDAELQGHLHVGGTVTAPQPTGGFQLRRGQFSLAGQTLTFNSGQVGFDGSGKIDPTLNFVANSTSGSITATLTITGYASKPKIMLSSTPELPQDEVLARLLFGQSSANLSPFQYAQIATTLADLSGVGGGNLDPLNSVRKGLGLDRLAITGGQNGSAPQVEAGSYVAPGVYVGARQGASGNSSQGVVQIDLLPGLKLETTVGTSNGSATGAGSAPTDSGTSIGLTYQFEY